MSNPEAPEVTEAALVAFGSATLHEAAGRRHLLAGIRLLVGPAFAGPAITVDLPAGDNLGIHHAIAAAMPDAVVCAASAGGGVYGVVGELLMHAARARKIAGIVAADGVRDIERLTAPPSIAALAVTPRGTVKRRIRQPVGADIAIGGALISSQDWIVCDEDGAVVLPARELSRIVSRAEQRDRHEATARQRLRAGESSLTVFDLP